MRKKASWIKLAVASFFICLFISSISIKAQSPKIEDLERAVAERRATTDDKSADSLTRETALREMASLLNQVGEIRFGNTEYELATKAFVDADTVLQKYYASAYARSLIDLKSAERQLSEFEKDPNPETGSIRVKIGRSLVVSVLSMVFTAARDLGDADGQRRALVRLGQIARADGDTSREAESLEKLGQLEFDTDNIDRAFELYSKALDIRKKSGKDEYRTLNYMAAAYWYLGDYEKAVDLFKQEIELTRKLNAVPAEINSANSDVIKQTILIERSVLKSTLAQALLNVAQIHSLRGKYGEANKAVDEVDLVIQEMKLEEVGGDESFRPILTVSRVSVEALVARMRGRLLEATGDTAGAAKLYLQAADTFSQISGGGPSGSVAWLRSRLAAIYSSEGKFDLARANVREAMRIRARLHQESGTTYALMQASRIELAARQLEPALKFARQAKAAALQLGIDDYLAESSEVEADALMAKVTGPDSLALEQAIVGYKTAIENYRQTELRPFLFRALTSLAGAFEQAGRLKEAETAYKDAVEAAEAIKSSFAASVDSESYSNRQDVTELYQRLIDLMVKQGRAEEALNYATRAQRRHLIDAVPKDEIRLSDKNSAALKQVAVAEMRVQAAESNAANSRGQDTFGGRSSAPTRASAIGTARQDYALAIKRLETEQPNLRFTVRPTDLLKLQATIPVDEAILSYLVTPDRLYIFVVRRGAVAVRTVDVSQNQLRGLIGQVRDGLKAFSVDFYDISSDPDTGFATERARPDLRRDDKSEHYRKNLAAGNEALRALDKKLIEPVSDLTAGAKTLRLIPNAELFLLPFSALISATDDKYLIERYDLTFVTAGDLISSPSKVAPGGMLFAFGNPAEANLDGAMDEVKAIQKVFPRSQLFVDDKATKEQLFKVTSARILHFATHGHINSPLESSKIQLARLPKLTDPDLSYGEIYALPLEASDMIVLSACETALGGVSGTEVGVFIEAFRTKTNTVAASLWSVDDFATRELMVEFYKNLAAGLGRSSALRKAQLRLLSDGRTKNPLFWAAFVLYGDGGKLSGMGTPAGGRTRR